MKGRSKATSAASPFAALTPRNREAARRALRCILRGMSVQAAARAVSVSHPTLRKWLAGVPGVEEAAKRHEEAARAKNAALLERLEKVKGSKAHCGITGKPCPKARRCSFAASESGVMGSEDARIELCAFAIEKNLSDCRVCPRYNLECPDSWECWKMGIGEMDMDLCGDLGNRGGESVFERPAAVYGGFVRARKNGA